MLFHMVFSFRTQIVAPALNFQAKACARPASTGAEHMLQLPWPLATNALPLVKVTKCHQLLDVVAVPGDFGTTTFYNFFND